MNIILDFDGTVADSLAAMIAIFNRVIRPDSEPLSPEEIQRLRGMTSRRALKSLGIRWWHVPRLVTRGLPDFHKLIPTLQSFEGLPEAIRQLYERGDKLYMVTSNTHDSVMEFLRLHELDGYFTEIVTGAGLFKKSKHIRKLIKKHHLKRRETIYVGDETRDIQAARLARIAVASVTWGFNTRDILAKQHPRYIVEKPEELLVISVVSDKRKRDKKHEIT